MTRRDLLGAMSAGTLLTLTGCGGGGSASYRFRMTVEVATPQGIKTGTGVMQVAAEKSPAVLPEQGSGFALGLDRAEAVAVDLPGGTVFALLKLGEGTGSLSAAVTRALAPEADDGDWTNYMAAARKLGGWFANARADLPRADWPLMVRFRDITDSSTVERVDPVSIGVKRIGLETTGDPLTMGIEKRLRWLHDGGKTLHPGGGIDFSGSPPLAKQIYQREFTSEIER